jgi:hypothetical protein
MTEENKIRTLDDDSATEKRGPTVAERMKAMDMFITDETTEPSAERDSLKITRPLALIVKNFRGFQKGQRGRRHECSGMDVLVITKLPSVIPIDEIDGMCEQLQRLKNAATKALEG